MAKYALNEAAVRNCRRLIEAKQYVLTCIDNSDGVVGSAARSVS